MTTGSMSRSRVFAIVLGAVALMAAIPAPTEWGGGYAMMFRLWLPADWSAL